MHAKLLKTRFGILYSLVAAVVALPSTSSQVSAARRLSSSCPAKHPATADSNAEREISPNYWRRLINWGCARILSSNHRTQERPPYAPA
jgi:hypothetical protein